MKISVALGRRLSDEFVLVIKDISNAVEIYDVALEKTKDDNQSYQILEKVNNGEFEVEE